MAGTAELKPGLTVQIAADDLRDVEAISFTDQPIDSRGTTGVRVHWVDHDRPSVMAADKELIVLSD